QVAGRVQVEHHDGHVVLAAQRDGRGVHHLELAVDGFGVGQRLVTDGIRVLVRILVVHAVHVGGLHQDVAARFDGAQGGGAIGGEVRVARTGGEQHHATFFKVA